MSDKATLRAAMKARRRAMPPAERQAAAEAAAAHLLASPLWIEARTVALFLSLPAELATAPLLEAATDKQVAVPVVVGRGRPLVFRALGGPLVPGPFGVLQPGPDAAEVPHAAFDLVVVPALAMDRSGRRLGYGGGFYDRTLLRCHQANWVAAVFEQQLVERVPTEAHDLRIPWLLTETGLRRTGTGDS